jgi:hypothetical protein
MALAADTATCDGVVSGTATRATRAAGAFRWPTLTGSSGPTLIRFTWLTLTGADWAAGTAGADSVAGAAAGAFFDRPLTVDGTTATGVGSMLDGADAPLIWAGSASTNTGVVTDPTDGAAAFDRTRLAGAASATCAAAWTSSV